MRFLGAKQLELLLFLAKPGSILMTPADRVVLSLERRGLLKPYKRVDGCGTVITPNGMRALADAYEAGRLRQFFRGKIR